MGLSEPERLNISGQLRSMFGQLCALAVGHWMRSSTWIYILRHYLHIHWNLAASNV